MPSQLTVHQAVLNRALASNYALLEEIRRFCLRSRKKNLEEWQALDELERKFPTTDREDLKNALRKVQLRKVQLQQVNAVLAETYDGSVVCRPDDEFHEDDDSGDVDLSFYTNHAEEAKAWHNENTAHHPQTMADVDHGVTQPFHTSGVNAAYRTKAKDGHDLFMKSCRSHVNNDSDSEEVVPKLSHVFGLHDHFLPAHRVKDAALSDHHVDNNMITTDWVDGPHFAKAGQQKNTHIENLGRDTRERLFLFDQLVGNRDRHHGNLMIKNKGPQHNRVVMIDHGLAFHDGWWDYEDHPMIVGDGGLNDISGLHRHNIAHMLQHKSHVKSLMKEHLSPDKLDKAYSNYDSFHRKLTNVLNNFDENDHGPMSWEDFEFHAAGVR